MTAASSASPASQLRPATQYWLRTTAGTAQVLYDETVAEFSLTLQLNVI